MVGDTGTDGGSDAETGFLDVAANALAVIILATMFMIILSAQPPLTGDAPPDAPKADLAMPARLDTAFPPLSQYYAVVGTGLVRIDLDALARQVHDGVEGPTTDQGRLTFILDRLGRRDYDEYRSVTTFDTRQLRAQAASMADPAAVAAMADSLEAAYAEAAFLPTFIVLPDGMTAFAPLYHALRERGLALRWFTIADGVPITLTNRPEDAETRGRRW